MPPRLKTLESQALAAGAAFGFSEDEFEIRHVRPARTGRMVAALLVLTGALAALAHHLGWTSAVAALGGWPAVG